MSDETDAIARRHAIGVAIYGPIRWYSTIPVKQSKGATRGQRVSSSPDAWSRMDAVVTRVVDALDREARLSAEDDSA